MDGIVYALRYFPLLPSASAQVQVNWMQPSDIIVYQLDDIRWKFMSLAIDTPILIAIAGAVL